MKLILFWCYESKAAVTVVKWQIGTRPSPTTCYLDYEYNIRQHRNHNTVITQTILEWSGEVSNTWFLCYWWVYRLSGITLHVSATPDRPHVGPMNLAIRVEFPHLLPSTCTSHWAITPSPLITALHIACKTNFHGDLHANSYQTDNTLQKVQSYNTLQKVQRILNVNTADQKSSYTTSKRN